MRSKKIAVAALAAGFFAMSLTSVSAAFFSGMITVTRDASRQISGAVLQTNNRDGAGNPVTYALVMDENGKAIAEQYENKDIKIEALQNARLDDNKTHTVDYREMAKNDQAVLLGVAQSQELLSGKIEAVKGRR